MNTSRTTSTYFLFLFLLALLLPASFASICSSFNPRCGLSASSARAKLLTPYAAIPHRLAALSASSVVPFQAGPLFVSSAHPEGLLEIDVPLNASSFTAVNGSVCGSSKAPTIRAAVVCTVTKSGMFSSRGNLNMSGVGYSTAGRVLYAARVGNPRGMRILITAQVHGNEPAGTEAVLRFLSRLARGRHGSLARQLDMLFLVRVNVDAGEPTGISSPPVMLPPGLQFGFWRQNKDTAAGGGFAAPTEPEFFGVVGRGYDPNRYNYFGLDKPIRPVESQAVVAAGLVFRPAFLFDMHGDVQKVVCDLNVSRGAVQPPNPAAGRPLPSTTCKRPAPPRPGFGIGSRYMVLSSLSAYDDGDVTFSRPDIAAFRRTTDYTYVVRASRGIAAAVMRKGQYKVGRQHGLFTRFQQINLPGAAGLSKGAVVLAADRLGAIATLSEVTNFRRAVRTAVITARLVNASLVPVLGLDTEDVEPCFLQDNICLHDLNLRHYLAAALKYARKTPLGDGGYCAHPTNNGVYIATPKRNFGPMANNGSFIILQAGILGVPVVYLGSCAGDVA